MRFGCRNHPRLFGWRRVSLGSFGEQRVIQDFASEANVHGMIQMLFNNDNVLFEDRDRLFLRQLNPLTLERKRKVVEDRACGVSGKDAWQVCAFCVRELPVHIGCVSRFNRETSIEFGNEYLFQKEIRFIHRGNVGQP